VKKALDIQILVDNLKSWYAPFAIDLVTSLSEKGHNVDLIHSYKLLTKGNVAFLLSCTKIIPEEYLKLHSNNIVCHPSDLPHGKGFSPLAWQIIEGKSEIVFTLFEAVGDVDAGPYYIKESILLAGHELNEEIKNIQGNLVNKLCNKYIDEYSEIPPMNQVGDESFYQRRTSNDSQLDLDSSIRVQFNLLRVVDNERYPAFFIINGHKYIIKISNEEI